MVFFARVFVGLFDAEPDFKVSVSYGLLELCPVLELCVCYSES